MTFFNGIFNNFFRDLDINKYLHIQINSQINVHFGVHLIATDRVELYYSTTKRLSELYIAYYHNILFGNLFEW